MSRALESFSFRHLLSYPEPAVSSLCPFSLGSASPAPAVHKDKDMMPACVSIWASPRMPETHHLVSVAPKHVFLLFSLAPTGGSSQEPRVISDSSAPAAHSHLSGFLLTLPPGAPQQPLRSPSCSVAPSWPPTSALIPPLLTPTPVTFPSPLVCK